jgi:hypothetical protein
MDRLGITQNIVSKVLTVYFIIDGIGGFFKSRSILGILVLKIFKHLKLYIERSCINPFNVKL